MPESPTSKCLVTEHWERPGAGMKLDGLTAEVLHSSFLQTPSLNWESLFLPKHKDLVPKLHTFFNQVEKKYHLGRIFQDSSLVISQEILGLQKRRLEQVQGWMVETKSPPLGVAR